MTPLPLLRVPAGWQQHPDPGPDVLVAARAAAPPGSGVPPELVLRRSVVTGALADDLLGWRRAAVTDLAALLERFVLDDEDLVRVDGRDVVHHRFIHRAVAADLVSEQWSWLRGGRGLTLTATVALEDHDDLCDVLERVAAGVRPGALLEAA